MQTLSPALCLCSLMILACPARADFLPLPLTKASYTEDMVVERNATPPIVPVTTASMDGGMANDGFSWYERGYNEIWLATGLPAAGSILTSDADFYHYFQFAPSYHANNVLLIDSTVTNGTLRLSEPAPYAGLSLLLSSGNGTGLVGYTIHFADQTTETGTFSCPNWFGGAGSAWSANGRVHVRDFYFDSLNSDNPKLFSRDITVAQTHFAITAIDFSYQGGPGHNAIFALSGTTNLAEAFQPIVVTGYNHDVVVEADALRAGFMEAYTTATMERGTINSRRTWYEQRYYPLSPGSGLPAAGSLLRSQAAPDHIYQLPASYTAANSVLLDEVSSNALLTLATPTNLAAISLLTASGYGPVTSWCVLGHADGSRQTNLLTSPDWMDPAPAAFSADGRINISSRIVDVVESGFPRLFGVDVPVTNTVSALTNIELRFVTGGIDAHAAVFAVSGLAATTPPALPPELTILAGSDASLQIRTTVPGLLQSTVELKGDETLWQDEGAIEGTRTVAPGSSSPARFYRVIAPRSP